MITTNAIIAVDASLHFRAQVVECAHCKGLMRETTTGYPHGVRWSKVDGRHVKLDCVGREVSR